MNKNILYVLLMLGLGGYYSYDTFYPEYVGWEAEIETLQTNLDQARRTAPKLADITREEEDLQQRLALSLEKLPSGAELDNLLAMVTPILEGVGIQSSQIGQKNVDAASEQDIYRTHPIRISDVRGLKMSTITQLLFELRNFHRIINVRRFDMSRVGEDLYNLNLDLETYSYIAAEGEELPAPAARPAPAPEPATPADAQADAETVVVSPAPDTAAAAAAPAPSAGARPDTARAAGRAAGDSAGAGSRAESGSAAPAGRR